MYEPGQLQVFRPCPYPSKEGFCDHEPEHEQITDSSKGYDDPTKDAYVDGVALPHSCDWWVIGGPAQIRALIADLSAALVKLETSPS